jgi:hypothetical protein
MCGQCRRALRCRKSPQSVLERQDAPTTAFYCSQRWQMGLTWMLYVSCTYPSADSQLAFTLSMPVSGCHTSIQTPILLLILTFKLLLTFKCDDINTLYSDNGPGRSIANPTTVTGKVSIETCTTACFNAGFGISGTEFAECVILSGIDIKLLTFQSFSQFLIHTASAVSVL